MSEITNDDDPESIKFYPFAYALLDDKLNQHCWYCLTNCQSLRRCKGCNFAQFCDKQCQSMAWNDHKPECKGLANALNPPNVEVRFLGRIVGRYRLIANGRDKNDPLFYKNRSSKRSVMELCSHSTEIIKDVNVLKCFDNIYKELVQFYGEKQLVDRELVFELYCRNFINRHSIGDGEFLEEIGKGLYLDFALYDHSCHPNAIYLCEGFVAILKKLDSNCRLLDTNSTFITYIELRSSKAERQKDLRNEWYFECNCIRCSDPSDDILTSIICQNCNDTNEEKIINFPNFYDFKENNQMPSLICQTCFKAVDNVIVKEACDLMIYLTDIFAQNILKDVDNETKIIFLNKLLEKCTPILSKNNIFYFKALINCTAPNDYHSLLDYHLKTLKTMRLCFPNNHPMLAYHLRNIGIYYYNLKQRKKSIEYLSESLKMFQFLFGKNHSITFDIEHVLLKYSKTR